MLTSLKKLYQKYVAPQFCENVNNTCNPKNCLLIYLVSPFIKKTVSLTHQNRWQIKELVRIIGEFGYNVDVMNYHYNHRVKLTKKYDLIVDIHPGLNENYQNNLAADCLKVAYITGSNPSFSNAAELDRIEALYSRTGVRVKPRRYASPFNKTQLESLEAMFFIGNKYNLKTFAEFDLKKVFFIKNTGYQFLRSTDFARKQPQKFLFLGGAGQVHKGLDLLLDVFVANRHLNLYVCSSFGSERDFFELYKETLLHSGNIFPVGFVDVGSKKFSQLCAICSFVVLPSCSEGIAGSVLAGMSAGLVPIVSRESGFEADEVHYLDDLTVTGIADTLNFFAQKPMNWIQNEALRAMDIVKDRYSEKNFSESVRAAMTGLLTV